MLATEIPPPPPPGSAAVMAPDEIAHVRDRGGHTGVMVCADGRLAVLHNGAGIAVTFADPDQLVALAYLLMGVAVQLDKIGNEARSEMGALLSRFGGVRGNA
jgi:hypothetical protein